MQTKNNKRADKCWTSGRDKNTFFKKKKKKNTFFASQVELLTWLPHAPALVSVACPSLTLISMPGMFPIHPVSAGSLLKYYQ